VRGLFCQGQARWRVVPGRVLQPGTAPAAVGQGRCSVGV